jgi:hypothetical protein
MVPDWGHKVDFGIGLSYWSVRLHRLAGRYGRSQLYPPVRDYEFGYWSNFHPYELAYLGAAYFYILVYLFSLSLSFSRYLSLLKVVLLWQTLPLSPNYCHKHL